jgi:hypothetical protein
MKNELKILSVRSLHETRSPLRLKVIRKRFLADLPAGRQVSAENNRRFPQNNFTPAEFFTHQFTSSPIHQLTSSPLDFGYFQKLK